MTDGKPTEVKTTGPASEWPKGFATRLAQFAERTNTQPPDPFQGEGEERTFSTEFLNYCLETGLSLDWVYSGEAMPLLMGEHYRAKRASEQAAVLAAQPDAHQRAYQVLALLRCAMLAEENETSGLDWTGTATVLGLAEELMGTVIDSFELSGKAKRKDAA